MPKPFYIAGKEMELAPLSDRDALRALDASARLPREFHVETCPVSHGASISCCAPFVCCVSVTWKPLDPIAEENDQPPWN